MASSTDINLRVEDLRVVFPGKNLVKAVDGVDLEVKRGEILSLVGESGSGKTTLGRTIVGLTKPTSGRIALDGKEVKTNDKQGLRFLWKKAQMIFQDPYSTFNPLASIYDSLSVPVRKFGIAKTPEETRRVVGETLLKVGLDPHEMEGKYPSQLSGGQKQRASIAHALVVSPEIIVADEPVSMLDVSLRAGILDLLRTLNEKSNVTIVFITHDLAVANYISDTIAVMYKGKIVEIAKADDVLKSPLHPYTELLIRSAPRLRGESKWSETQDLTLKDVPASFAGCNFYPRCPISASICTQSEPPLFEILEQHRSACHVRKQEHEQIKA